MRVYFYSGLQNMIEKSGVGRAIYHQRFAAKANEIGLASCLEDADIVHINTVFPGSLLLAKKAEKRKIPVVYHAHSTREDFRNSYIGSDLLDGLFGKWIRYCYETGTVIVTPTPYAKRLLQSYGIETPIEVVSNGIDLARYDRTKVNRMVFRKKYGYGAEEKIVMCAGLTIERKGITDFVKLAESMPEYQFIWFGETNLHLVPKKVRKAVQTRLPNLRFAGYVKPEELKEAYGSCDLFCFPSREETEGIVVLEALAMKIPVLLRDISVYADWLKENRDVYKATDIPEFRTKIKEILEHRCPDLTESGYRVVQERSIEKVGMRLGEIYKRCMEK